MPIIERLEALEILDSRGRPTMEVTCHLKGGSCARAQVPSGASTGIWEAIELRDEDSERHNGMGCRKAVANVADTIAEAIIGTAFDDQQMLDQSLIDLDGTPNKARLGANAILGVSLAFARAVATENNTPLYSHLANAFGHSLATLPMMTINLFSGGKHAGGQVPIQDVLIVPVAAKTIDDGLVTSCSVIQAAAALIQEKYGMRRLTADEGGLAPPFATIAEMFEDAVTSIERAGLQPGRDVAIAVDVASSHFYQDGAYFLGDEKLTAAAMLEQVCQWVDRYPIISVEDGLAEDDWQHWPELRSRLADQALTLGDDLLCTNPARVQQAIDSSACDALLLKVNQIGTLTEAHQALSLARSAGWHVTVSARSGETEDDWLADLAVAWSGNQIKVGSLAQSERTAKYNRLLAIEAESQLPVAG